MSIIDTEGIFNNEMIDVSSHLPSSGSSAKSAESKRNICRKPDSEIADKSESTIMGKILHLQCELRFVFY